MRKPRDFDAELTALTDKAKTLQARKLTQLGELVVATAADILPVETLAGALLAAADTKDAAVKEAWRKSGAAFFQRSTRRAARSTGRDTGSGATNDDGAQSFAAATRAS